MAKEIKNIKTGQRFLVIDTEGNGFEEKTIVESLKTIDNIDKNRWFECKWIGGTKRYEDVILRQKITHLKRFKGKIK